MRAAAALLALLLPLAAAAQDVPAPDAGAAEVAAPAPQAVAPAPAPERLADLRASLGQIGAELQALRAELVASGAEGFAAAGGDAAIDRMNAMEAEIARLTGRIEALENRIAQVVRDGTNRLGDIEFRLCEMDPNCDLGALSTAQMQGAEAGEAIDLSPLPAPDAPPPAAMTGDEAAAWAAAQAAMAAGDPTRAAQMFGDLAAAHPGTPLAADALYFRGVAQEAGGDAAAAAQTWLQGFAAAPAGSHAPDALLGIARVLADQGKTEEACLFLDDLAARFAGSPAAAEAEGRGAALSCAAPEAPAEAPLDPEAAADAAEHGG